MGLERINRKNLIKGWLKGTFVVLAGLVLSIFDSAPRPTFWRDVSRLKTVYEDPTDEEVIRQIRFIPCHYAVSGQTVWEVRPTNGLDTNGGAFVAGSTGTDWSNQNAAQYAVADAVTAGTTTITSATANFGTDVVGNILYIQGGTGTITAGWYQITVRTNATTITVDRSTGLTTGTGATLNIGGALKTLSQLAAVMVGSNKAFVKAEATITSTASIVFGAAAVTVSETVPATHLIGYTTSRGDGGQVAITLSTNTGIRALRFTNDGWIIDGFNINCSSLGTSIGIQFDGASNSEVRNCKVANFTQLGISQHLLSVHHCEITGGTSAATVALGFGTAGGVIYSNYVHDNVCSGIVGASGSSSRCSIIGNVVANNSGASSDGIVSDAGNIRGNSVYKNGRHGIVIQNASSWNAYVIVLNNIITDHTAVGAAGLKCNTAALPADPRWDGNAYYNNTANRVNMDDTSTNAVDGVSPYVNTLDVLCTVSPWTNAAGNDFTLNNTAGGGAAVRAAFGPKGGTLFSGIPGLPTLNGYLDGGVFQHKDAGGGILVNPGMRGGMS